MTKIYRIEDYQYLRVFDDIEGYLRFDGHAQSDVVSVSQMLGSHALAFYYNHQEHTRGQVLKDVRRYIGSQPNSITNNNIAQQEIDELLSSNDYQGFFNFLVYEIHQIEEANWQDTNKAISIRILYHLALALKEVVDKFKVALEQ